MGTQDTTITNESEAMEVAEAAYSAGNLTTCDGYYEFDLDAAARVIATALGARDAELKTVLNREADTIRRYDAKLDERAARIAELERALRNPPGHHYWGAGEPDCPREIKCGNGELHTLRCKVCGEDSPRNPICLAALGETANAS